MATTIHTIKAPEKYNFYYFLANNIYSAITISLIKLLLGGAKINKPLCYCYTVKLPFNSQCLETINTTHTHIAFYSNSVIC